MADDRLVLLDSGDNVRPSVLFVQHPDGTQEFLVWCERCEKADRKNYEPLVCHGYGAALDAANDHEHTHG